MVTLIFQRRPTLTSLLFGTLGLWPLVAVNHVNIGVNLAQADTHQPVTKGLCTVGVEGHALVSRTGGCCTEVRWFSITAPLDTPLVAIISVTRNEKARVERMITDQELVGVSITHGSHAIPQSVSTGSLSIVQLGNHGQVRLSFKVGLVSSLVINEDNFWELKTVHKEKKSERRREEEQI